MTEFIKIYKTENEIEKRRLFTLVVYDGNYYWPKQITELSFRNEKIICLPANEEQHPRLIVRNADDPNEGWSGELALNFLSSMALLQEKNILAGLGGFSPNSIGAKQEKRSKCQTSENFCRDWKNIPEGNDEDQRLAMGLFRQGLNIKERSVFLSFLSFFNILHILNKKRDKLINPSSTA